MDTTEMSVCLFARSMEFDTKWTICEQTKLQSFNSWTVYGHFGPKTLRTQDISALYVWYRSVSQFLR